MVLQLDVLFNSQDRYYGIDFTVETTPNDNFMYRKPQIESESD